MRYLRVFLLILLITTGTVGLPSASIGTEVVLITIDGAINPVSAEYISKAIKKAEAIRAEAVIIQLDTPGGLDNSMRLIVKDIIASQVPVIVYVAPSGARAGSAGVFITMIAHIAAMAPGTNIGAAHPVAVGASMDNVTSSKAQNDASAYIRSLAEQRGRNAEWAEKAVRQSASVTETEALQNNIIDLIAKDLSELLKLVHAKEVKLKDSTKVLNTENAKIIEYELGIRQKILDIISNPTVAYMLMMLGFYGLFFELNNPGSIAPGVIGAICLILAFYSFQTLPINYAGLLLIIAGIIMFILEIKVMSYGLLTIGGIASIILGSMMLIDSPDPMMRLSLELIIPIALTTALFFTFIFRLAYKAQKLKPVTGLEGMVSQEAIAITDINSSSGTVQVHGEIWQARSQTPITAGTLVVIDSIKGLTLHVHPKGS